MFDDYIDEQPMAVSIFENAINEDKLSHAYLIDTNNYTKAYDFILCFVKNIVCLDAVDVEKDDICRRIDEGNYTELKIIEADGNWIKKEQMLDLQESFSLKGIEGKKRIYIIKECEKMNAQTANSILKFLEEPDDNIIAILMSNNISQLLDTIVSRCQFVRLNSDKYGNKNAFDNLCDLVCLSVKDKINFLKNDDNKLLIDDFLYFINKFEELGTGVIVDIKKIWHDKFINREYVEIAIDLWINLYYDLIRLYYNKDILFFIDYEDEIKKVYSLIDINVILDRLYILIDAKYNFKYNLNVNLFINKLIIDMVGEK